MARLRTKRRAPRRYRDDTSDDDDSEFEEGSADGSPEVIPQVVRVYNPNHPPAASHTQPLGEVRSPPPEAFDLKNFMGDAYEETPDETPEEKKQRVSDLYKSHLEAVCQDLPDVDGVVKYPITQPDGEVTIHYMLKAFIDKIDWALLARGVKLVIFKAVSRYRPKTQAAFTMLSLCDADQESFRYLFASEQNHQEAIDSARAEQVAVRMGKSPARSAATADARGSNPVQSTGVYDNEEASDEMFAELSDTHDLLENLHLAGGRADLVKETADLRAKRPNRMFSGVEDNRSATLSYGDEEEVLQSTKPRVSAKKTREENVSEADANFQATTGEFSWSAEHILDSEEIQYGIKWLNNHCQWWEPAELKEVGMTLVEHEDKPFTWKDCMFPPIDPPEGEFIISDAEGVAAANEDNEERAPWDAQNLEDLSNAAGSPQGSASSGRSAPLLVFVRGPAHRRVSPRRVFDRELELGLSDSDDEDSPISASEPLENAARSSPVLLHAHHREAPDNPLPTAPAESDDDGSPVHTSAPSMSDGLSLPVFFDVVRRKQSDAPIVSASSESDDDGSLIFDWEPRKSYADISTPGRRRALLAPLASYNVNPALSDLNLTQTSTGQSLIRAKPPSSHRRAAELKKTDTSGANKSEIDSSSVAIAQPQPSRLRGPSSHHKSQKVSRHGYLKSTSVNRGPFKKRATSPRAPNITATISSPPRGNKIAPGPATMSAYDSFDLPSPEDDVKDEEWEDGGGDDEFEFTSTTRRSPRPQRTRGLSITNSEPEDPSEESGWGEEVSSELEELDDTPPPPQRAYDNSPPENNIVASSTNTASLLDPLTSPADNRLAVLPPNSPEMSNNLSNPPRTKGHRRLVSLPISSEKLRFVEQNWDNPGGKFTPTKVKSSDSSAGLFQSSAVSSLSAAPSQNTSPQVLFASSQLSESGEQVLAPEKSHNHHIKSQNIVGGEVGSTINNPVMVDKTMLGRNLPASTIKTEDGDDDDSGDEDIEMAGGDQQDDQLTPSPGNDVQDATEDGDQQDDQIEHGAQDAITDQSDQDTTVVVDDEVSNHAQNGSGNFMASPYAENGDVLPNATFVRGGVLDYDSVLWQAPPPPVKPTGLPGFSQDQIHHMVMLTLHLQDTATFTPPPRGSRNIAIPYQSIEASRLLPGYHPDFPDMGNSKVAVSIPGGLDNLQMSVAGWHYNAPDGSLLWNPGYPPQYPPIVIAQNQEYMYKVSLMFRKVLSRRLPRPEWYEPFKAEFLLQLLNTFNGQFVPGFILTAPDPEEFQHKLYKLAGLLHAYCTASSVDTWAQDTRFHVVAGYLARSQHNSSNNGNAQESFPDAQLHPENTQQQRKEGNHLPGGPLSNDISSIQLSDVDLSGQAMEGGSLHTPIPNRHTNSPVVSQFGMHAPVADNTPMPSLHKSPLGAYAPIADGIPADSPSNWRFPPPQNPSWDPVDMWLPALPTSDAANMSFPTFSGRQDSNPQSVNALGGYFTSIDTNAPTQFDTTARRFASVSETSSSGSQVTASPQPVGSATQRNLMTPPGVPNASLSSKFGSNSERQGDLYQTTAECFPRPRQYSLADVQFSNSSPVMANVSQEILDSAIKNQDGFRRPRRYSLADIQLKNPATHAPSSNGAARIADHSQGPKPLPSMDSADHSPLRGDDLPLSAFNEDPADYHSEESQLKHPASSPLSAQHSKKQKGSHSASNMVTEEIALLADKLYQI